MLRQQIALTWRASDGTVGHLRSPVADTVSVPFTIIRVTPKWITSYSVSVTSFTATIIRMRALNWEQNLSFVHSFLLPQIIADTFLSLFRVFFRAETMISDTVLNGRENVHAAVASCKEEQI